MKGLRRRSSAGASFVLCICFLSLFGIDSASPGVGAEGNCGKNFCGRVGSSSFVVDGQVQLTGAKVQPQASPRAGSGAAPGAFEFVRSQVCGGPGYVPEGGTGCGNAACVDPAATRFTTARRAVGAPAGTG